MKLLTRTTLCAVLLSSAGAYAGDGYHCYDFSRLAEDRQFEVGAVIETRHATIRIQPYLQNGEPATADASGAGVATSAIAGGSSPELALKLVALSVVPKKPITGVRTRIAQSISQSGAFADVVLMANGHRRASADGFAGLDGAELGNSATGTVRVSTDIPAPKTGNWHKGRLELRAEPGSSIEGFTLSGHTWNVDDLCVRR